VLQEERQLHVSEGIHKGSQAAPCFRRYQMRTKEPVAKSLFYIHSLARRESVVQTI